MKQATVGQLKKWMKGLKNNEKLFAMSSAGVQALVLDDDHPCEAISNDQTMIIPESRYGGTFEVESVTIG